MNASFVIEQLAQDETDRCEFKASFQKQVIESVVAFANAKGGFIMVGVDDKGQVLGVELSTEMLKDWQNQIKNSTYPQVIPDMNEVDVDGKQVVVISVQEQPIKPIAYKQRYFKRIRNANHLMTLDEIANEHLKTLNASWDYYVDNRHDFGDISQDKISAFIQRIERHQHKQFDDDLMGVLRKYELIKEGKGISD